MKNLLLLSILSIGSFISAQVQPPTPPVPPEPPVTPKAPEQENKVESDTTRINLGSKELLIIDKAEKKSKKQMDITEDNENSIDEAQEQEDISKKGKMHKKHKENMKPSKKSKKAADVDFLDLDLGLNFYSNPADVSDNIADDLNLKLWSWSTTFNFLPTKFYLGSRNFGLMTSLGWRIGRYNFENAIEFTPGKELTYSIDSSGSISKSLLSVHHLQIPLMLYVQSNKIKGLGRIGIGLGGYAGIKIHESSKLTYKSIDRVVKTKEDFGFDKYRYGLSARIEIGALKFFANMDMNNTWKNQDLRTLECGIWLDF